MKSNKIVWTGTSWKGHINIRRAELLRRMSSVDKYTLMLGDWKILRGLQRYLFLPILTLVSATRYPLFFCTDRKQIPFFPRRIVYDYDDPQFAAQELSVLSRRNVMAVVVPTKKIQAILREKGFQKPINVIPQGVAANTIHAGRVSAILQQWRLSTGEIIVGLHQPLLSFRAELSFGQEADMYGVDFLFETMERIHRRVPEVVLWLVGQPSEIVREYAGRNPWVRLLGYLPHDDILNAVSAFDIGLYPRRVDYGGRGSIKIIEYMACGVPVVGMSISEMEPIEQAGAGLIANSPEEYESQIVDLCCNPKRRIEMGKKGRAYSARFTWDRLAEEYTSILNAYLL